MLVEESWTTYCLLRVTSTEWPQGKKTNHKFNLRRNICLTDSLTDSLYPQLAIGSCDPWHCARRRRGPTAYLSRQRRSTMATKRFTPINREPTQKGCCNQASALSISPHTNR